MFKENKSFWLYFLGIIILFFFVYSWLRSGFEGNSLGFSSFPFNLGGSTVKVYRPGNVNLDFSKDYEALVTTNFGDFVIDLYENNTPNTVANFISLVNNGYYTDTDFYRLIPGLLIQGGSSMTKNIDPKDDIFGGPGYTIPDEINWDSLDYSLEQKEQLMSEGYKSSSKIASKELIHYSVAMAGNGPNTGGGQFFIVISENSDTRLNKLKGRHTVFGGIAGGYQVFDEIARLDVDNSDPNIPRPEKKIIIQNIIIKIKD